MQEPDRLIPFTVKQLEEVTNFINGNIHTLTERLQPILALEEKDQVALCKEKSQVPLVHDLENIYELLTNINYKITMLLNLCEL